MKKWIFGLAIFLLFIFWQLISLYLSVQNDKEIGYSRSVMALKQDTDYTIIKTERFHGNQRYFIFTVEDENNENAYVLVDEDQRTKEIKFKDMILPRDRVRQKVVKDYPEIKEIRRVSPAFTEGEFTWEVLAYDQEGKLQYVYYTMLQGTFQKRYRLTQ